MRPGTIEETRTTPLGLGAIWPLKGMPVASGASETGVT